MIFAFPLWGKPQTAEKLPYPPDKNIVFVADS